MAFEHSNPPGVHQPAPTYTHLIRVKDGDLLFISGQIAFDEARGRIAAELRRAERSIRVAMYNIRSERLGNLLLDEGVRAAITGQYRYVLVDEYQDTNHAQYILVKLLTEQSQNLCVVGDGDQCLPPGTMIATPQGARPIETVEVGDEMRLVKWTRSRFAFFVQVILRHWVVAHKLLFQWRNQII